MTKKKRRDLFNEVTTSVITALESGTIPWERPWANASGSKRHFPRSVSTGKVYSGINIFTMFLSHRWECPWYLTFRQAKKLGGSVRGGEKGTMVVFWKMLKVDETDEATGQKTKKTIPMLRNFTVFNVEQCDLPDDAIERLAKRLDRIAPKAPPKREIEILKDAQGISDAYTDRSGVAVNHGGSRAYYSPAQDYIQMPDQHTFNTDHAYYATLFHEEAHSTGHESRLNRIKTTANFGSEDYSREELTAEMGAAFLCAVTGISKPEVDGNRDAYIASWIKALKDDERALVVAAGKAQKAADYILAAKDEGDEGEEALKS